MININYRFYINNIFFFSYNIIKNMASSLSNYTMYDDISGLGETYWNVVTAKNSTDKTLASTSKYELFINEKQANEYGLFSKQHGGLYLDFTVKAVIPARDTTAHAFVFTPLGATAIVDRTQVESGSTRNISQYSGFNLLQHMKFIQNYSAEQCINSHVINGVTYSNNFDDVLFQGYTNDVSTDDRTLTLPLRIELDNILTNSIHPYPLSSNDNLRISVYLADKANVFINRDQTIDSIAAATITITDMKLSYKSIVIDKSLNDAILANQMLTLHGADYDLRQISYSADDTQITTDLPFGYLKAKKLYICFTPNDNLNTNNNNAFSLSCANFTSLELKFNSKTINGTMLSDESPYPQVLSRNILANKNIKSVGLYNYMYNGNNSHNFYAVDTEGVTWADMGTFFICYDLGNSLDEFNKVSGTDTIGSKLSMTIKKGESNAGICNVFVEYENSITLDSSSGRWEVIR